MTWTSARIIVATGIAGAVSSIVVAARVWARRLTAQPLEWDDWLIFASLALTVFLLGIPIIVLAAQIDVKNPLLPDGEPKPLPPIANVATYILESCAPIALALSKASILLFYKRVFRGRALVISVYTILAFVVAWAVTFFFVAIFQCSPISRYLSLGIGGNWIDPSIQCIDQINAFYASAAVDVALDLAIMIVPIPIIWKLQMPPRKKFGVFGVFILGGLTIVTSLVRLGGFIAVGKLLQDVDIKLPITFLLSATNYWTFVEACLSIIAACLPSLTPIFARIFSRSTYVHLGESLPWSRRKASTASGMEVLIAGSADSSGVRSARLINQQGRRMREVDKDSLAVELSEVAKGEHGGRENGII